MSTMTYDYHELKSATGKLEATIEQFRALANQINQAGTELVAENNAEGVKSTMTAFGDKVKAIIGVMEESLEIMQNALANAKELHIANGGDE